MSGRRLNTCVYCAIERHVYNFQCAPYRPFLYIRVSQSSLSTIKDICRRSGQLYRLRRVYSFTSYQPGESGESGKSGKSGESGEDLHCLSHVQLEKAPSEGTSLQFERPTGLTRNTTVVTWWRSLSHVMRIKNDVNFYIVKSALDRR